MQSGWADELQVPIEALTVRGTHLFHRDGSTTVVVVKLNESVVIVAPAVAAAELGRVQDVETSRLLDMSWLEQQLRPLQARPIGTADLSYCEVLPVKREAVPIVPATTSLVDLLQRGLSAEEWLESGLADMPSRWAALTASGEVAAIAGYESWSRSIAQLGVASVSSVRGRGFAAAAAAEAMTAALGDGLVPQWRCRVGNRGSERLATSLGFTPVGRQTAVALTIP